MAENLEQIKAVLDELSTSDLPVSARMVAVLFELGIEEPKELERMMGLRPSSARQAKRQLKDYRCNNSAAEQRDEITARCDSAALSGQRGVTAPPRVRARNESPSEIVILEEEKKERFPPTPQGGAWDDLKDSHLNDGVILGSDGRIELVNGTRAYWLEQFDGDEVSLNLALIEVSGERQPNSRQPLKLQTERSLAGKARRRREQDHRYQKAVDQRPAKTKAAPERVNGLELLKQRAARAATGAV